MKCKNDNKEGVNTCNVCGEWLCEDCSVEIEGRIYCKECATIKLDQLRKQMKQDQIIKETDTTAPRIIQPKRNPNIFLTLAFSMLPGCAQMYMGLMQRGLIFMGMFFAMAYLRRYSAIFFYTGTMLWFYNFFDSFNMRRLLLEGTEINETIDIKTFFDKNKLLLLGGVILVAILEIIQDFRESYTGELFNTSLVVLIVVAIAMICYKTFLVNNKKDTSNKN